MSTASTRLPAVTAAALSAPTAGVRAATWKNTAATDARPTMATAETRRSSRRCEDVPARATTRATATVADSAWPATYVQPAPGVATTSSAVPDTQQSALRAQVTRRPCRTRK